MEGTNLKAYENINDWSFMLFDGERYFMSYGERIYEDIKKGVEIIHQSLNRDLCDMICDACNKALKREDSGELSFGEWYCYIKRITADSPARAKLAAYLEITRIGRPVPEFLKPYK